MRKELMNFDWFTYGLSKHDYNYTLEVILNIIEDRKSQLPVKRQDVWVRSFDGDDLSENEDLKEEAYSDIAYYTEIENSYLWHFGLWRLQGIFEGLLKLKYFPNKQLLGLKSKLDFAMGLGFNITKKEYNEILKWGKLRNALSHNPPEMYRPGFLRKDDLIEYKLLLEKVSKTLND